MIMVAAQYMASYYTVQLAPFVKPHFVLIVAAPLFYSWTGAHLMYFPDRGYMQAYILLPLNTWLYCIHPVFHQPGHGLPGG